MKSTPNNMSRKERNKQRVLRYLQKYINEHAYSPSVREIAVAVGFKSTSTVHSYLNELQDDGYINYADGKRRAISINEDNLPGSSESNIDNTASVSSNRDDHTVTWPLVGLVTAGQPILAQENTLYDIQVDNKLFPSGKDDSFLLRVRGDSMFDAGIFDGDMIVVSPTPQAELNEIVVALIGEEATVKRFAYLDGEPYLFPENDAFDPIPFNQEDCSIIGKVVGLIRTRL